MREHAKCFIVNQFERSLLQSWLICVVNVTQWKDRYFLRLNVRTPLSCITLISGTRIGWSSRFAITLRFASNSPLNGYQIERWTKFFSWRGWWWWLLLLLPLQAGLLTCTLVRPPKNRDLFKEKRWVCIFFCVVRFDMKTFFWCENCISLD